MARHLKEFAPTCCKRAGANEAGDLFTPPSLHLNKEPFMKTTFFTIVAARAEIERLQTIIDNLHAVGEKHRETANNQFHRANRLQVEIEQLTKERQAFEGMAQVAAAYEAAAEKCDLVFQDGVGDLIRGIGDEIRALTPADAQAALAAYGRSKVREGMQRAAEVARECWNDPPCEADAEYIPNAILADMEKLK